MAPEQAEGRPATVATDVHALGTLLYELLTGRPPFLGVSRLDTLQQVVQADPVPPRRLNPAAGRDLETICLKCLRKETHQRYASARDLAEDLHRFQGGEPIRARPVGRVEIAWRWCRRRPAQALLGAALLLAVVSGVSLVVWQWRRAEHNYREAERLSRAALGEAAVEDSFRLAHEAVKDVMMQAGQPGLLDAHGLEPLRRDLLIKGGVSTIANFFSIAAATPPCGANWPKPPPSSPTSRAGSATRRRPSTPIAAPLPCSRSCRTTAPTASCCAFRKRSFTTTSAASS